jgi:uncharacterized protein (DUF362 family)
MLKRLVPLCLVAMVLVCVVGCEAAKPAGPRPVVAIVQGDDANVMVAQAIELVGGLKGIVKDGDRVVVKPNLTFYNKDKGLVPGMTTDIRVAAALVAVLRKSARCQVTIAESSGANTKDMYRVYGYEKFAAEANVPLLDLKEEPRLHIERAGMAYPSYEFPKAVKEADVFINVPVLKTHQLTGISVGMKNLYGLLDNSRTGMHEKADAVLSDMASIRHNDLIVVDGLAGMEGQGPLEGTTVKMNLVIVGTNVVAVDAVAAAVMGFDPSKLRHLQIARDRGLGECDLSKIEIRGTAIDKVAVHFKPPAAFPYACPKTKEQAKKLARVIELETAYQKQATGKEPRLGQSFRSDILKLDPAKYPRLCSRPFSVDFSDGSRFHLSCDAFERPLVVEEINRWLADSAPVEIAPHSLPKAPEPRNKPTSQPASAPK